MKKSLLTIILTLTALCAHAQVGQTYNQLVKHFGKGQWENENRAYHFNDGFYCITASFGPGHAQYCDLILYSHLDGHDFTKAEVEKLAHRTYGGIWYTVKPVNPNNVVAIWGVRVEALDLYAMLFNNDQYLVNNPSWNRTSQALMIGIKEAFQARGYWRTPSQSDGEEQNQGGDQGGTY